jgi:hypothetical protein
MGSIVDLGFPHVMSDHPEVLANAALTAVILITCIVFWNSTRRAARTTRSLHTLLSRTDNRTLQRLENIAGNMALANKSGALVGIAFTGLGATVGVVTGILAPWVTEPHVWRIDDGIRGDLARGGVLVGTSIIVTVVLAVIASRWIDRWARKHADRLPETLVDGRRVVVVTEHDPS